MYKFLFVFLLISNSLFADEAANWLKKEIDYILNAYDKDNLTNIERFNYIINVASKYYIKKIMILFLKGIV